MRFCTFSWPSSPLRNMRQNLFLVVLVILALGAVYCGTDLTEERQHGSEELMEKKGRTKRGRNAGKGLNDVAGMEASENGYRPEGATGGGPGAGNGGGKKRKNRKGGKGKGGRGAEGGDEDAPEEERRLSEEPANDVEDRAQEMERRREELRARKQQEIRDRYKDRRGRDMEDFDQDRMHGRDRDSLRDGLRAGVDEDYLSARHKEIRDRHSRRDKERGRDRTGRRDRKRSDDEGRHAVLRRRIDKHAHLFTPVELAEIEEDLRDHKVEEDKLDDARDKLNAQFDAVRDIDDRDKRLARLEQLKEMRNSRRDADRQARDVLREQFQAIRDRLEAKLKTELR